jgi:hypothetical protein
MTTPPQIELVYVAPEDVGKDTVLDADQRAVLEAWSERLIPGDAFWPSAGTVGTAAYVESVMARSSGTHAAVARALAGIEEAAQRKYGRGFAACAADEQDEVLASLRDGPLGPTHQAVLEFTYEDYYRAPSVTAVMLQRTGFDSSLPVTGSPMEPFDDGLLDRVRTLPPRYREVS